MKYIYEVTNRKTGEVFLSCKSEAIAWKMAEKMENKYELWVYRRVRST